MDLRGSSPGDELWQLPESLVRELWDLAKKAEWSYWNPHWRAHSCPTCGEPQSLKRHSRYCRLASVMEELTARYPQVTQAPKLDAAEEFQGMNLLFGFYQRMEDEARRRERGFGMADQEDEEEDES